MIYNVFSGTLNPTQSIDQSINQSSFSAVSDFSIFFIHFLWESNISGTAERICVKFTGKTCLVRRSDEFEGQGQRSPGTEKRALNSRHPQQRRNAYRTPLCIDVIVHGGVRSGVYWQRRRSIVERRFERHLLVDCITRLMMLMTVAMTTAGARLLGRDLPGIPCTRDVICRHKCLTTHSFHHPSIHTVHRKNNLLLVQSLWRQSLASRRIERVGQCNVETPRFHRLKLYDW